MPNAFSRLFTGVEVTERLAGAFHAAGEVKEGAKAMLEVLPPAITTPVLVAAHAFPPAGLVALAFVAAGLLVRAKEGREKHEANEILKKLMEQSGELKGLLDRVVDERQQEEKAAAWIRGKLKDFECPAELGLSADAMLALAFEQRFTEIKGTLEELRSFLQPEREMVLSMLYRRQDLVPGAARAISEAFSNTTKDASQSLLGQFAELLVQNEARPLFELPIAGADPRGPRRLVFSERYAPALLGRRKEWDELLGFLEDPNQFRWWLWFGDGGQGKSRLALELCLHAIGQGWHAGFIRGKFPERIDQWEPIHPTLFIVDYAAAKAENLGRAIAALSHGKSNHPVRILALERQYSDGFGWAKWLKSGSDAFGHGIDECRYSAPKLLQPISDAQGAFMGLFETAYRRASGRQLTAHLRTAAQEHFQSEIYQRRGLRPLYALMAAQAAAESQSEGEFNWKPEDLIEYLFDHEQRIWQEENQRPTQADVNLAYCATLAGGLTAVAIDGLKTAQAGRLGTANEERAAFINSHTHDSSAEDSEFSVPALEPDLVGEGLIWLRLAGKLYLDGSTKPTVRHDSTCLLDQVLDQAEHRGACHELLGRLAQDFISQGAVREVLEQRADKLPTSIRERLAAFGQSSAASGVEREAAEQISTAGLDEMEALGMTVRGIYAEAQRFEASYRWSEAIETYAKAIDAGQVLITGGSDEQRLYSLVLTSAGTLARDLKNPSALQWLEKALQIDRTLAEASGDTPGALRDISISLDKTADVLLSLGRTDEALKRYEESLVIRKEIRNAVGETPEALRDVSVSLNKTADTLRSLGRTDEALKRYEESLAIRKAIRNTVGDTPEALRDVSVSLSKTADVVLSLGRADEALKRYEESLAICQEIRTTVGDTPEALRDVSISLNKTADVLLSLGRTDEALKRYEESLAIRKEIRNAVGDTPEALRDISISLDKTADVLLSLGRTDEALKRYEESLVIRKEIRNAVGETPEALRDVSVSLNKTADTLRSLGRTDEALKRYEESLAIRKAIRNTVGDTPEALRDVSVSLSKTADVVLSLGRADEALKRYEESLAICQEIRTTVGGTPEALRDVSVSLDRTADVLLSLGRTEEALQRYEESLAIRQKIRTTVGGTPEALRDVSISLDKTADVLLSLGRTDEALKRYEESLVIRKEIRNAVGETPEALRDVSISLDKTADVLLSLGRTDEALKRYEESLAIRKAIRNTVGDTPEAVRDLVVSHVKLFISTQSSAPASAAGHLAEARKINDSLVATYPDIVQFKQDKAFLNSLG